MNMQQISIKQLLCPKSEAGGKFVDLFCGCGGASEGAREAGLEVVLAVDSWEDALEVHKLNHPETNHVCTDLPSDTLPLPSGRWHMHGSPPCTKVSNANQQRNENDRFEALNLIKWYIEFAMSSSATSWSMEQVACPVVVEFLESLKPTWSRTRFAYTIVHFQEIGVPQNRRRLIAGSPDVVARVLRLSKWRRSVRDVISKPRGTHIRNRLCKSNPIPDPSGESRFVYTRYTDDEQCAPIDGPSRCVVAGYFLRWATPNSGKKLKRLSVRETAALQCFPKSYEFHKVRTKSRTMVGNAIPPIVMYQILRGKRPAVT